MDILEFITLVITGFTSCAEFGSYAFVHPVIRQLPPDHHIRVEQGLLKTFGRVMPGLMTLCVILSLSYAISLNSVESGAYRCLGIGGFLRRWSGIHNHLQCSDKRRYRPVERQQPAGEMEKDKKPLGILSRYAVLVASDWFRALVSSHRAA